MCEQGIGLKSLSAVVFLWKRSSVIITWNRRFVAENVSSLEANLLILAISTSSIYRS